MGGGLKYQLNSHHFYSLFGNFCYQFFTISIVTKLYSHISKDLVKLDRQIRNFLKRKSSQYFNPPSMHNPLITGCNIHKKCSNSKPRSNSDAFMVYSFDCISVSHINNLLTIFARNKPLSFLNNNFEAFVFMAILSHSFHDGTFIPISLSNKYFKFSSTQAIIEMIISLCHLI